MLNLTGPNWEPRQAIIPARRVETEQALQREGLSMVEAHRVLDDALEKRPETTPFWKRALKTTGQRLIGWSSGLQTHPNLR